MFKENNEQSCMFFDVREDFNWVHSHGTRHVRPYRFTFNRLALTDTYFLNDALDQLWSRVPVVVKTDSTFSSFKVKIRQLILLDRL